jgi:hypothetical protein
MSKSSAGFGGISTIRTFVRTYNIYVLIRRRKWGWIGHTLRKPPANVTRQALDWNPQGKRKVGRPRQMWRRRIDAEVKTAGTTWAELKGISRNRIRWKSAVAAICSHVEQED